MLYIENDCLLIYILLSCRIEYFIQQAHNIQDKNTQNGAGRFMLGKYLSDKKNPMAAKETIGDGGGRKYGNSQLSDQNRQDEISRASAVQNGARGPR